MNRRICSLKEVSNENYIIKLSYLTIHQLAIPMIQKSNRCIEFNFIQRPIQEDKLSKKLILYFNKGAAHLFDLDVTSYRLYRMYQNADEYLKLSKFKRGE